MSLKFRRCPPVSRENVRLGSWPKPRIFWWRVDRPRGSEAVRVVPIRGFSVRGGCVADCCSRLAPVRSRSSRGGLALRSEDDRVCEGPWAVEPLLTERSSGGGVGGNTFRLRGGSECCRVRLVMPLWTRFVAPQETPSRSSKAALSMTMGLHW